MGPHADDTRPTGPTHVDGLDRTAREALARELGVDDWRIAKAIRMVGTRISTIRAYLGV